MLELEYPWLAVVLAAPLLLVRLLKPYREERKALRIAFFQEIAGTVGATPRAGAVVMRRSWLQVGLAVLVWGLVVAALTRPQWVEDPIEKIQSGRDMLLAVDVSQSMDARDFVNADGVRDDRLTAVKEVIGEFIERRRGDRIGLILFGAGAYPQAPLTLDHDVVALLLDEAEIGMAGPATAIGDAIGLSVKLLENSEATERTLVLLTDGNDTASKMPPPKAAEIAAEAGIVVHTIGIGNPEAASEDKVDLEALEEISSATGGRSFRGEDRAGLEGIYRTLDEIEPDEFETLSYRPKTPLFQWPLGTAIALILIYQLLMTLSGAIGRARRTSRPAEATD